MAARVGTPRLEFGETARRFRIHRQRLTQSKRCNHRSASKKDLSCAARSSRASLTNHSDAWSARERAGAYINHIDGNMQATGNHDSDREPVFFVVGARAADAVFRPDIRQRRNRCCIEAAGEPGQTKAVRRVFLTVARRGGSNTVRHRHAVEDDRTLALRQRGEAVRGYVPSRGHLVASDSWRRVRAADGTAGPEASRGPCPEAGPVMYATRTMGMGRRADRNGWRRAKVLLTDNVGPWSQRRRDVVFTGGGSLSMSRGAVHRG